MTSFANTEIMKASSIYKQLQVQRTYLTTHYLRS